jgi:UDP-glucose 4-epimerase
MTRHDASLEGRSILVTGVSGFIGGSIAGAWARAGARVVGLRRGPMSPLALDAEIEIRQCTFAAARLTETIEHFAPEVLLHAAGSASVAASMADPNTDFNDAVSSFQIVLEAVRKSRHRPLIVYPSSAAVYGNPQRLPVSEDAALAPVSPYGHHKVIAETLARGYATCFGLRVLALRMFSVFGPRQRRLLVWDLFRQFRTQDVVHVRGTGDEVRDFLHVEDIAVALATIAGNLTQSYTVANLASGRGTNVREMALMIGRLLASEKEIHFGGYKQPGDPDCWIADTAMAERLGAGIPTGGAYDLENRIAETLRSWR